MFKILSDKVTAQFKKLEEQTLYKVELGYNELWEAYLDSFDDPIERQDHNCNHCKSFIRQFGGIVAIKNHKIATLWDFEIDGIFAKVPKNLGEIVRKAKIVDVFISSEAQLGTKSNYAEKTGITWSHFNFTLRSVRVYTGVKTIDSYRGDMRTNKQVLERALTELKISASETVLDLIDQNDLYRGQEHAKAVRSLLDKQKEYAALPVENRELFLWENINFPNARIRNTAIGTLLIDLSEGMELDAAVSRYESVVAPQNYKRPNAIVTQKMVEEAQKTLISLGCEAALYRRHANVTDIKVTDLMYVNRSSTTSPSNIFEEVKTDLPIHPKTLKGFTEISIENFVSDILPSVQSLEVFLENRLEGNFVNIVAPIDPEAPTIFTWDNGFSWCYNTGFADSIKEKVKKAGGRVDGYLRASSAWYNYDDLDIHMYERAARNYHLYYGNRNLETPCGGILDVDMNAGGGTTREPVENIIYASEKKLKEGIYEIVVNNYCLRESTNSGFEVELECNGETWVFRFANSPRDLQNINVVTFEYKKGVGIKILKGEGENKNVVTTKLVNGLGTNKFHKVSTMMFSPNYWGNNVVGNKHFIFTLLGARSEAIPRAFFNEFLRNDLLTQHKRVFEVIGGKIKIEDTSDQLCGLGFSETQRAELIIKANGKLFKLLFGATTHD
jgi:hypothetical protein